MLLREPARLLVTDPKHAQLMCIYSDLQKVFGHLIRTLKMPVIELDNRKRVRPFHRTNFTLLRHLRNVNQSLNQPLPSGFVVYE